MHIAYTINGEGMGHASRSSVVIEYLLSKGHRVSLFSSGARPLEFLRQKFGGTAEVTGLHMVYRDNRVRRLRTAVRALKGVRTLARDRTLIRAALDAQPPQAVITDFDFHGTLIARRYGVPLISIDNIQYITQARFTIPARVAVDYRLNHLVAKMMVPRADYYFITSFDKPQLKRRSMASRVHFVPPILRRKIVEAQPVDGDHILVYQTSDSYANLFSVFSGLAEKFIVYNTRQARVHRNVTCKEFNEDSFIADLISAKAVIVNGGFTVMTESIHLHKPVLSIPIANHFEQYLNGALLQHAGYGFSVPRISSINLKEFIARIPRFKTALASVNFSNEPLTGKLSRVLQKL